MTYLIGNPRLNQCLTFTRSRSVTCIPPRISNEKLPITPSVHPDFTTIPHDCASLTFTPHGPKPANLRDLWNIAAERDSLETVSFLTVCRVVVLLFRDACKRLTISNFQRASNFRGGVDAKRGWVNFFFVIFL